MASQRLGLPCHSLSAPRVPTPILCKTVHFAAVPLRRILFHCCAFALLFLARPSPCHSDLRLLYASSLYAIPFHIRSMQFPCFSSLRSALLSFALPLLRRSGLCRASHLHRRTMLLYSVTIHCTTTLFSAMPLPLCAFLRHAVSLLINS